MKDITSKAFDFLKKAKPRQVDLQMNDSKLEDTIEDQKNIYNITNTSKREEQSARETEQDNDTTTERNQMDIRSVQEQETKQPHNDNDNDDV